MNGYWYNVDATTSDNANLQSHLDKYFNKPLQNFHTTPEDSYFPNDRLNYVTN